MAHPLLVRAAQLIEQARTLNDEFEDKSKMPAEVAQRIDRLLDEAGKARRQVEREASIDDHDKFLHQTDYKSPVGYGAAVDSKAGAAVDGPLYLTDGEKKTAQKAAFFEYLRKGVVPTEYKADLVEDANGGLLVPQDYAGTITQALPNYSVIRSLALVRTTARNKADLGVVSVNKAGWGKLETGAATVDGLGGAPTVTSVKVRDLFALVKIGEDELDDADADLEAAISNALLPTIAQQEDEGFAAGTGDTGSMPDGLLNASGLSTPITAATVKVVDADELKSLAYQVPQRARAGGVFVGSTAAEKAVALLVDGNGRYLMQWNSALGEPPTIFGYRWYTNDGFPAPGGVGGATKSNAISFGNWGLGYMIADRQAMTVRRLNERYIDAGEVGFLFKLRVGGAVIRPKAFALYNV